MEICSSASPRAVSIDQTAFVLAHATNNLEPSRENRSAFGCSPTGISRRTSRVFVSMAMTFAPPQTDTYTIEPSGETAAE
jgi:hypothetical protein